MLVHIRLPLAGLLVCLVAMSTGRLHGRGAVAADAVAPEPAAATDRPEAAEADETIEPGEEDASAALPPAPTPAAAGTDTDTDTADTDTDAPLPPDDASATNDAPQTAAADEPGDDAGDEAEPSEPMIESTADAEGDAETDGAAVAPVTEESEETAANSPTDDASGDDADVSAETATAPTVAPASKPPVAAKPAAPPKKPVLVPGAGTLVAGIGDDFEDEGWKWNYHHPKSSEEQDKRMRGPMGRSVNSRWFEGPKRGTPDVVKRIALPAPGLEGSGHGLLIATLNAGIPGRTTYQMQQDDLIYNMQKVTGRGIPVGDSPSVVTRVYVPPFAQWEKRNGPTFGFRAGCYTHATITGEDHPDRGKFGLEEYWPGMFICFEPANPKKKTTDSAYLRIRGGRNGGEIRGPQIDVDGWWTLGLSFSPDGMVHYFASPGVDDLTMEDHITSQFPYGYRTEWLKTFFFNVCSKDDGKTWSTPWVIDDPKVFFIKRQVATTTPAPTKIFRKR